MKYNLKEDIGNIDLDPKGHFILSSLGGTRIEIKKAVEEKGLNRMLKYQDHCFLRTAYFGIKKFFETERQKVYLI